ncbi:MAG: hypothetical protein WKF73_19495 [Nocardioidaceae bacterium]
MRSPAATVTGVAPLARDWARSILRCRARYSTPPAGVLLIRPEELVAGMVSRLPWKSLIASRSSRTFPGLAALGCESRW